MHSSKKRVASGARREMQRLGCKSNTAAVAEKLAFYGSVQESPRGMWAGKPGRQGNWETWLDVKVKGVPAGRGLHFAPDEKPTRAMMPPKVTAEDRAQTMEGSTWNGPPKARKSPTRKQRAAARAKETPAMRRARRIVNN